MMDENYAKACVEVETILENVLTDFISLIPKEFMEFIKESKKEDYIFKFDRSKTLHQQDLMEETKAILTIIYRDFFCFQEQRNEINSVLLENDNKYNVVDTA